MANDVIRTTVEVDTLRAETDISYVPVILALTNEDEHSIDADIVNLKNLDLSQSSVNPQTLTEGQTEVHHLKVGESKEAFNIVVRGQKIYQSTLRGRNQLERFHNPVIFEYSRIWDRMAMLGADGNKGVINNNSPKTTINASSALSDANSLAVLMTELKIQMSPFGANQDILVYIYGTELQKFLGRLSDSQETSFRKIMEDTFPNATFVDVPSSVMVDDNGDPITDNGFVVCVRSMVTLHTSLKPDVRDTGFNNEDDYEWAKYIMGSTHVSVDKDGAMVRQPVTIT